MDDQAVVRMRPLSHMPPETRRGVVGVFADIDDTITSEGRLEASAYAALERLHRAGMHVVPVTGRPAGWCDMIARFWPVDGVVGENGALYFAYDRGARRMVQAFAASPAERADNRRRLEALAQHILAAVPGTALASDQRYREADVAIDFREDVAPLDQASIARTVALFEEAGAVAKVSSIHVNGWFGSYDKLTMARRFARERLGVDLDAERHRFVYAGDSPNDAPMFGFFPNACGVANVRDFADRMPHLPAYVAPSRGGRGFVEIAEALLSARGT